MTETTDKPTRVEGSPDVSVYSGLWVTFVVVLIGDQFSKWIIVKWSGFELGLYPPFGGLEVIPDFFNLVYAVNHGAAWGIMEGFSWLLIILALLVLVLVATFRHELLLQRPLHQLCFGLICGGITGNTLDRIFRGHVVDFLDFHIPWYRWPTFNVADTAIVVGTFLYIWQQFRKTGTNSG